MKKENNYEAIIRARMVVREQVENLTDYNDKIIMEKLTTKLPLLVKNDKYRQQLATLMAGLIKTESKNAFVKSLKKLLK